MDVELDNLSIADLQSRYGLESRQSVYNRLKHLGITPQKGKISADDLKEMDKLHVYLQQPNAKMNDYPVSTGQLDLSSGQTDRQPEDWSTGQLDSPVGQIPIIQLLQALEAFALVLNKDPLAPQRQLTEIADRQWVVSTSQLHEILGTKPREGTRLGFRLRKVGRSGREVAWKVEKSATVADLVEWHHSPLRP